MNASKENAIRAAKDLRDVIDKYPGIGVHLHFIVDFITVAHRKLPSEAAYTKDKKRKAKA